MLLLYHSEVQKPIFYQKKKVTHKTVFRTFCNHMQKALEDISNESFEKGLHLKNLFKNDVSNDFYQLSNLTSNDLC